MENKYYIYFHINPVKNEIFYVGKGHGKRAWSKHRRSRWWKDMINKYGWIVNIVEEGLSNEEASVREKFYIQRIGRRDLGLGPLVNLTDGGEGCHNMSPITKAKISEKAKGRKASEETKLKISKGQLGNKRYPQPQEVKDNLRKKLTGRIISQETKDKHRKSQTGKSHSVETINKISTSNMGRIPWNKGLKYKTKKNEK